MTIKPPGSMRVALLWLAAPADGYRRRTWLALWQRTRLRLLLALSKMVLREFDRTTHPARRHVHH